MTRVGFEPTTYGLRVMTDLSSGFYLHRLRSLFPRGIRKLERPYASEFDAVYVRLPHNSAHVVKACETGLQLRLDSGRCDLRFYPAVVRKALSRNSKALSGNSEL